MINICDLHVQFEDNHVLRGVNLSFERGKVYGFIGSNGSGKSTLFRSILQLQKFDGTINFDPDILTSSFIPTSPFVSKWITGRDFLEFIANNRSKNRYDFKRENVFNLPLDEYFSNYSSGMLQQLMITSLIVEDSDLIILDEPFNALDFSGAIRLKRIILEWRNKNKIVLFSSHIFPYLKELCDILVLLQDGTTKLFFDKSEMDVLEESLIDSLNKEN